MDKKKPASTRAKRTQKKRKPTAVELKTQKNKTLFLARFVATGNISEACKQCDIGRQTYYDWLKKDQDFALAFSFAEESLLDFAEGKLMKMIDDKVPAAVLFFLKCKGRERGYIEPTNINLQGSMKHSHTHDVSLRDLEKSYDRVKRKNKK